MGGAEEGKVACRRLDKITAAEDCRLGPPYPRMPVSGFTGRTRFGRSAVGVAALLPVYRPPDPASRTVYVADKGAIPLN